MRVLATLCVTPLLIGLFHAPASAQASDGTALAAQCAARDWNTYMNCQRELLDARRAGGYCVPGPDNAARYQVEFVRFARDNPTLVSDVPAPAAAAAYFSRYHGCS
ncbi:MAG: hypothetical protein ACU85U_10515 [Gammaproteobacteria bacterium]|jgi:hypothetical protein